MRIGLLAGEVFLWGKFGGFGKATRILGRELARRGVDVAAVVPRRSGYPNSECTIGGMRVFTYPVCRPGALRACLRGLKADILQSQEPSTVSWLAQRHQHDARHLVVFQDTRLPGDWTIETRMTSHRWIRAWANRFYEDNPLVHAAVHRADARYCACLDVGARARSYYGLPADPPHLPTPVEVPPPPEKSSSAQVCFISRWNPRKRPERFLRLARRFPTVQFAMAGQAQDAARDRELRMEAANIPNLRVFPFLDQFRDPRFRELLGRSWVIVNTSAREGLPNTFIEAAAHGTAILSQIDTDGFASGFGHHVRDDDFEAGLEELLAHDSWRKRGELGREYVLQHYELEPATRAHLEAYEELLGVTSAPSGSGA